MAGNLDHIGYLNRPIWGIEIIIGGLKIN